METPAESLPVPAKAGPNRGWQFGALGAVLLLAGYLAFNFAFQWEGFGWFEGFKGSALGEWWFWLCALLWFAGGVSAVLGVGFGFWELMRKRQAASVKMTRFLGLALGIAVLLVFGVVLAVFIAMWIAFSGH